MFEWSEIEIARAQQEHLQNLANHTGRNCKEAAGRRSRLQSAVWIAAKLGNWLLLLGLKLQSHSADLTEGLTSVQAQSINSAAPQAEQKC